MQINPAKVKALVGLARSFPHSPLSEKQVGEKWIIEKKEYNYENIERIKKNENHDLCIVTLARSVTNISPLCLPSEPMKSYEKKLGKYLGFGYRKGRLLIKKNFPRVFLLSIKAVKASFC